MFRIRGWGLGLRVRTLAAPAGSQQSQARTKK